MASEDSGAAMVSGAQGRKSEKRRGRGSRKRSTWETARKHNDRRKSLHAALTSHGRDPSEDESLYYPKKGT